MKLATLLRFRILAGVAFGSAVFFASGVAVGQLANTSKFAKYLRSTARTGMDQIMLEANVDLIRDNIPMEHGIGVPRFYFNYRENRPQASVFIGGDFEKSTLDTIKSEILEKYYLSYYGLKNSVPELSEDDFVLQVLRLTSDTDRKVYAECKHGAIIFH